MRDVLFHPVSVAPRVHVLSAEASERVPGATVAKVDHVWREMSEKEPGLYDAPNLRVVSADPESGLIVCERSSFKHLVTAPRVGRDVKQLGIVGWVTCGQPRTSDERLLIARRSETTRVFQNMWENAPSGGVQAPARGFGITAALAQDRTLDAVLTAADLYRSLEEESEEELDFALPRYEPAAAAKGQARVRFVGWLDDAIAQSVDLVVAIHLNDDEAAALHAAVADEAGSDEYSRRCWLMRDKAPEFLGRQRSKISPPTQELLRAMPWRVSTNSPIVKRFLSKYLTDWPGTCIGIECTKQLSPELRDAFPHVCDEALASYTDEDSDLVVFCTHGMLIASPREARWIRYSDIKDQELPDKRTGVHLELVLKNGERLPVRIAGRRGQFAVWASVATFLGTAIRVSSKE